MDITILGPIGLTAILLLKETLQFLHKNRLCDVIAEQTKITTELVKQVSILAERMK